MKSINNRVTLAILAIVALTTSMSAPAKANYVENFYNCTQFMKDGQILIGAQPPRIVLLSDSSSSEKLMAIRLAAVVPNAKPTYEILTQTFRGIDATIYESQNYSVNFYFIGGRKAHIQTKVGQVYAQCEAAGRDTQLPEQYR